MQNLHFKLFRPLSAYALLLLMAPQISAQQIPAAQQQMLLQMAEQSGLLQQASVCSGISSSQVKKHLAAALQQCPVLSNGMPGEECVKNQLIKNSGVSQAAVQKCEQMAKQAQQNSAAGAQSNVQSVAALQQQGIAQLRSAVDSLVNASQGTTANIPAPMYPGSKVLVHLPAQGMVKFGNNQVTSLPGVSFASTATAAEVLSWYQQKFPAYQYRKIDLGGEPDHLLLKNAPEPFDYLKMLPQLPGIPHVFITAATGETKRHLPGAKTLFTVTYQP
jgi:hypothetical protein